MLGVITVDCWDTILAEPRDLDAAIQAALIRGVRASQPTIRDEVIAAALKREEELFGRQLQSSRLILSPQSRARTLLEVLATLCPRTDVRSIDPGSLVSGVGGAVLAAVPEPTYWAAEFLSSVAALGIPLYLVSNTGWLSSTTVLSCLRLHGLQEYFRGSYFSGDGYLPKPAPSMFRVALADCGQPAGAAAHVGDQAIADGRGAVTAGFSTVVLVPGRRDQQQVLTGLAMDCVVHAASLREAWDYLFDGERGTR